MRSRRPMHEILHNQIYFQNTLRNHMTKGTMMTRWHKKYSLSVSRILHRVLIAKQRWKISRLYRWLASGICLQLPSILPLPLPLLNWVRICQCRRWQILYNWEQAFKSKRERTFYPLSLLTYCLRYQQRRIYLQSAYSNQIKAFIKPRQVVPPPKHEASMDNASSSSRAG